MSNYADLIERLERNAKQTITRYCGDLDGAIVPHALLTEAAACIREMVEHGERSVDYEIWQDDALVAGSDNEADARHYAAVYEQDGPVQLIKVVSFRSPLPPAPGAEDA